MLKQSALLLLKLRKWGAAVLFFIFLIQTPALALGQQDHKLSKKCVQIYYNQTDARGHTRSLDKIYAIYLLNLIGHFPSIQRYLIPVRLYKKGGINRCYANFYVGTNFHSQKNIPKAFLKDFITTKKQAVWIGFGINRFSPGETNKLFGIKIKDWYTLNLKQKSKDGLPGRYNHFLYKGERFEKDARHADRKTPALHYAYLILETQLTTPHQTKVIAWAQHSVQKNKIPYIIKKKNHWYVADNPFAYSSQDGPYLIFSDVLFDILDEPARHPHQKPALIRLEDISPSSSPQNVLAFSAIFDRLNIPFSISLIPVFRDPLGIYISTPRKGYRLITETPELIKALHDAKSKDASFILHGVSHQYKSRENPFNAVSGADFEYWDKVKNKPITEDSVQHVLSRLNIGVNQMKLAGLDASAWLTPHYLASALDYLIFSQVFSWNVGRIAYMPYQAKNLVTLPNQLTYNVGGVNPKTNHERLEQLSKLDIDANVPYEGWEQFFPYAIYGDYYQQRVIPENLGNIQPTLNEQVISKRSVDQILITAKRNLVLRDVWGSLFVHTVLLKVKPQGGLAKHPGDTAEIERLVTSMKKMGYTFINLKSWVKNHMEKRAPRIIEGKPSTASPENHLKEYH